jgi:hypothetical protein
MTTLNLLKDIAQKIITFTSNKEMGSETWDEQPSAPKGGFADRAGFILLDNIECCADVALIEQNEAIIRARSAKVTHAEDKERFLIITLDFSADTDSVKKAIENHSSISKQVLIDILGQEQTVPKFIQVSYNTGRDNDSRPVGTRYEYSKDQIMSLSEEEGDEFAKILMLTFDNIMGARKLS